MGNPLHLLVQHASGHFEVVEEDARNINCNPTQKQLA